MKQIVPILKRIQSPDINDLLHPNVNLDQAFSVSIVAMFGPSEADGEESFGFIVCNRQWIEDQKISEASLPTHYIVLKHFSYDEIVSKLLEIALLCEARDWSAAANKLARFGLWEFDGYVP